MITRKDIYIGIAIFALILFGNSYLSSMRDAAKQDQLKADTKQQIEQMRSDLKSELAKITADKQEAKTPAQIVQKVPQYIEVPKPIFMQPPQTAVSILPDAPQPHVAQTGDLVIPQESASAFFQKLASCKEDGLKLDECSKELPLVTKRAEVAEKAIKGGGFWSRTRTKLIWLGIGVGAGYLAHH